MGPASAFAFLAAAALAGAASQRRYNTRAQWRDDKLNVHLVPHTHDDVGWLKTVDQYLYGGNDTIQHAGVQYILDSVMTSLEENPDRHFIYVESGFFHRWWVEQDEDMQARVKALVKSGQLEFINGGWCMHDEASTHYIAMVDQTTTGHRFLLDTFNVTPKAQWQIDPFGHSSTQAALLSAESGYDSIYFARIDYQDKAKRSSESTLEMLWRASPSLGPNAQVFTGVLYYHYGPPPGFCWDQSCSDDPMRDDERLEEYNVQSRVDDFVKVVMDQAGHYRGGHVMLTMGSDFQYENANKWYKNLDKLIHYVNKDGRLNAFYSTPSLYTEAKHAANLTWSVKEDDFFPYADCPHCYWTGYFTSRSALKRYARQQSASLNAARHVLAAFGGSYEDQELSQRALGVSQHHDAISGTAKQHVAFDYARRLGWAEAECSAILAKGASTAAMASAAPSTGALLSGYAPCSERNVSVCAASQSGDAVLVTAYNPLGREARSLLRVPVESKQWRVDAGSEAVASEVVPRQNLPSWLEGPAAPLELRFEATIPAFSFKTFKLSPTKQGGRRAAVVAAKPVPPPPGLRRPGAADTVALDNGDVRLTFSTRTGLLQSYEDLHSGLESDLSLRFYWWNASAGFGQNSGAYIFRPNGTTAFSVGDHVTLEVLNGTVCKEARQSFSPWLNATTRLCMGSPRVEVEWTVGAVPIADGLGKEVIARYTTNIATAGVWYTDSNGREMIRRQRNHRPTWKLNVTEPVAGNYYPVNAAAFMNDGKRQMTVLVDRSQAMGSLSDGAMDFMVQRRLLHDDARGVGEPLNETTFISPYPDPVRGGEPLVVRGTHTLMFTDVAGAAAAFRPAMDDLYFEPQVLFATASAASQDARRAALRIIGDELSADLPDNVQLMSFMPWRKGQVLVRLAHQFAVGEDATMSKPATVSLASLLGSQLPIAAVNELSLTANRQRKDMRRLAWTSDRGDVAPKPDVPTAPEGPAYSVTLNPMQVRTFAVTLKQ